MDDRVLVTGASGFLGSHLCLHLISLGFKVLGTVWSNRVPLPIETYPLDVTDNEAVLALVSNFRPSTIVHCAALSRVLECEADTERAVLVNVHGTCNIVNAARACLSHTIFISTDQVFDGESGNYTESDTPAPTHVYGRSKLVGEQVVGSLGSYLILRSNNLVGRSLGCGTSFTDTILDRVLSGQTVDLFDDQYRSPIHVTSMIEIVRQCIIERKQGILHAGGPERLSRYQTGLRLADAYHLDPKYFRSARVAGHPQRRLLHRDGSFDTMRLHAAWLEIASRRIYDGLVQDAESAHTS